MQYWWVNQNVTFRHAVDGGYLWSPKTNANGRRNPFYDSMTRVEPGDVVFSFSDTRIKALSVAVGVAYECARPSEFGILGDWWSDAGWRVDVSYEELPREAQIRPKDSIETLRPYLPAKYSPLNAQGNGSQSVYLTEVPSDLAAVLLGLIGEPGRRVMADAFSTDQDELREISEERLQQLITAAPLEETEKMALVAARRGQGLFRQRVLELEPRCRITGVATPALLTASHIRPWNRCENHGQRLDVFNGLMLTPTFDRLFDRGLISFSDDGAVLISSELSNDDVKRLGLEPTTSVGRFHPEQCAYLAYHREHIFHR